MTEIPQEWVEKAAERLHTLNPECVATAEGCAREALAAVLPDVRYQVAEKIATAIEAKIEESREHGEQAGHDVRIGETIMRAGLQSAARIAREVRDSSGSET